MPRLILPTIVLMLLGAGLVFTLTKENEYYYATTAPVPNPTGEAVSNPVPVPVPTPAPVAANVNADAENQKPLENPPEIIKAVYATSWSAGSVLKMNHLVDLIKKTELNAIVIDIKDFSGVVMYDIKVPEVLEYKARQIRIPKINNLIKRLHDEGIYVIGRLTVFQDPALAKARPEWAVKNLETGRVWTDNKGLSWMDAGSKDVWDYNIAIAKDAFQRGFDEINFDYVRFPSDGNLKLLDYPITDFTKEKRSDVIRRFFQYLRSNLKGHKISADVFGLTTVDSTDLGIGQIIEHAFENFDYVAPMIYPSHFASGFQGYKNPAAHPYEVILHSMQNAYNKLINYNAKLTVPVKNLSKLRPWLQSFDLGATYDAAKIRAQIKATTDALCKFVFTPITPAGGQQPGAKIQYKKTCEPLTQTEIDRIYNGWMLWDPRNNYIKSSLLPEN